MEEAVTDLDELERLDRAATPGPWGQCGAERGGCICGLVWSESVDVIVAQAGPDHDCRSALWKADAALVVAARNALPDIIKDNRALLARAEKAEAALVEARKERDAEAERIGERIVEVIVANGRVVPDGSGCDSGDPADFIAAQVSQTLARLIDEDDEKIAILGIERDQARAERDALRAEGAEALAKRTLDAGTRSVMGALSDNNATLRARLTAAEERERRVREAVTCAHCGKPAVCVGQYESADARTPACDDCCAHGNEDGHCDPLTHAPEVVAALATDAPKEGT